MRGKTEVVEDYLVNIQMPHLVLAPQRSDRPAERVLWMSEIGFFFVESSTCIHLFPS